MWPDDERDLVADWAADLADTGHAAPTSRRYVPAVRAFLIWFADQNHEPFTPARLTSIDLTGYTQQIQRTTKASTVNVYVCALRSFCAWLAENGHVERNPALRLKSIGMPEPLAPKSLKPTHVNALLREAQQARHGARDYALIQLMVQTGIRIGECASLLVGDVQLSERRGQMTIRTGKGNKTRTVPLNASARQALAEYLGPQWGVESLVKVVAAAWAQQPASSVER